MGPAKINIEGKEFILSSLHKEPIDVERARYDPQYRKVVGLDQSPIKAGFRNIFRRSR